ncbi:MAG: ribosome maturation factor RimP [Polyangiaceae bacterium]
MHPASNEHHDDPLLARLRELIAPLCAGRGIDLVDVRWVTEHGARTLRVTIERISTSAGSTSAVASSTTGWGVSLDDCADLSRDISAEFDRTDPIDSHYQLEVSSPGLERQLYSLADFRRFQGSLARAKLSRPAPDGQRVLRGTIASISAGDEREARVTMQVDGKQMDVPYADVVEANLVFVLEGSKRTDNKTRKEGARRGVTKRS